MLKKLLAGVLSGLVAALRPALDGLNLPKLKPGQTSASQVRRIMGPPTMEWSDDDGTQTWEYARTPNGIVNYMIVFDADQLLTAVRQVLTDENFARVRAGMSCDEVRRLLGQPAHELFFSRKKEAVWDWKIIGVANTPAWFNVHFGDDGRVLRTSTNSVDAP
jgi:outer membrane protein assembly factor BamE (lipoprotein component of BamABCDE complex)